MSLTADIPKYRQGPDLDKNAREMNVELIRERLARKEYEVDADKVAGAIIERLLAGRFTTPEGDSRD
jgi:anti-sigma28 factor (negative regulator of flagellin synthesis)